MTPTVLGGHVFLPTVLGGHVISPTPVDKLCSDTCFHPRLPVDRHVFLPTPPCGQTRVFTHARNHGILRVFTHTPSKKTLSHQRDTTTFRGVTRARARARVFNKALLFNLEAL